MTPSQRARLLARPARRQRFRQALGQISPAIPGVFAWGVVTGVAMVKGGLTVGQAVAITLLVMSGTTQLTAVPMLAAGVSLPIIGLTAVLTGLRFPVYAAALARDLKHLRPRWRWLAGFLMTDPGSAVYLNRRAAERPFANRMAYYAGINYPIWPFWIAGSLLGIALATRLPATPKLAYLGVLAILALAAPLIRGPAAWSAALVGGTVALIGRDWPWKLGLIAAVIAGVAVAMRVEQHLRDRAGAAGRAR